MDQQYNKVLSRSSIVIVVGLQQSYVDFMCQTNIHDWQQQRSPRENFTLRWSVLLSPVDDIIGLVSISLVHIQYAFLKMF